MGSGALASALLDLGLRGVRCRGLGLVDLEFRGVGNFMGTKRVGTGAVAAKTSTAERFAKWGSGISGFGLRVL